MCKIDKKRKYFDNFGMDINYIKTVSFRKKIFEKLSEILKENNDLIKESVSRRR